MTQRTMPVRFLRAAAETAAYRNADLDDWVRQLDIEPSLLLDDRSRITLDQATHAIQEIWRLTGDELAGMGPVPAPRGTFRLVSLALLSSRDVRTALERLVDFSRVVPAFPSCSVSVGATTTRLHVELRSEDDPAHLLADLALALVQRFLGWLVGRRLPIDVVQLPYPMPDGVEDYDLLFGAPLEFDSPAPALVLRNEVLGLPIVRSEEDLEEWLRKSPSDLLTNRDYGTSVADQVRRILERGLRGDWPTADDVSAQLAMSTQHLRRVLREEGTSMSAIKEELLRDAAIASLVRADESIAALSDRLGFSEPSAFHRAFRRWTGSAPGAYRPLSAPAESAE